MVLRKLYPHYRVLTQYAIKCHRHTLFLDYYIPQAKIAAEYDGIQHDQYVAHFHGNRQGFEDSKYRDGLKEDWCASHGVKLLRFKHYENITITEIRKKLSGEEKSQGRRRSRPPGPDRRS